MHRLLSALVSGLCLAVALPAPAGEPPASAASEPSYAQTRELIRLGWLDLAERGVGRLADPSEAALARGWLAERRAGFERDPRKQLAHCDQAGKALEEFRKAAPADHRLRGESAAFEAALNETRFRVSCAVLQDPRTTPEERAALGASVEEYQRNILAGSKASMDETEGRYAAALASGKGVPEVFDAYVRVSGKCLQEMIRLGEFWPPASKQQKAQGAQIVELASAWLKKQGTVHPALTEEQNGVQLFMDYVLGHGHALAGEVGKAVEQFKKVTDAEVGEPSPPFMAIWTRAVYYKARTLADAAEKSGKKADWKVALEAIDARIFQSLPGTDLVLAIKARILKGKCLGKLGALEEADAEYDRALQATEGVEEPRLPAPAPRR